MRRRYFALALLWPAITASQVAAPYPFESCADEVRRSLAEPDPDRRFRAIMRLEGCPVGQVRPTLRRLMERKVDDSFGDAAATVSRRHRIFEGVLSPQLRSDQAYIRRRYVMALYRPSFDKTKFLKQDNDVFVRQAYAYALFLWYPGELRRWLQTEPREAVRAQISKYMQAGSRPRVRQRSIAEILKSER